MSDEDHPDVITLTRKLTDSFYTLTAAEKLLSTSRQTLKEYARKYQHGLRLHYPTCRAPKLSKENIIIYLRDKFYKDFNFLVDLVERTER